MYSKKKYVKLVQRFFFLKYNSFDGTTIDSVIKTVAVIFDHSSNIIFENIFSAICVDL